MKSLLATLVDLRTNFNDVEWKIEACTKGILPTDIKTFVRDVGEKPFLKTPVNTSNLLKFQMIKIANGYHKGLSSMTLF